MDGWNLQRVAAQLCCSQPAGKEIWKLLGPTSMFYNYFLFCTAITSHLLNPTLTPKVWRQNHQLTM